jgi:hypothetical protein
MGRPTLYTDELAAKLVEALASLPIKYACGQVRIHPDTYTNWIAKGDAGEEPFATFSALARESRANYIADRLRVIHEAAPADWKAAAWYLERACPEDFGAHRTRGEDAGPARRDFVVDLCPPSGETHDGSSSDGRTAPAQ